MTTPTIRILLIEDNAGDARLVFEAFCEAQPPAEITHVDRLQDGLTQLENSSFDILLMDLSLPDSRGLEGFFALRAKAPKIPILVLTGSFTDEAMALKSMQSGAQDYLIKQEVAPSILARAVRYALERARLDRMKDHFVSVASHELRAPLAVVKSLVDNLMENLSGPLSQEQRAKLEAVDRNIGRLSHIINNLLDLSRLESGLAVMNRRLVDIAPLLRETVQNFRVMAQSSAKEIDLIENFRHPPPSLSADSDMIAQVFSNLTDNALRFSRKIVVLQTSLAKDGVEMQVTDDGPGIPANRIGDLFNRFVQIQRPAGEGLYKGTGLGLAICKEIINLHGGRIWAESSLGQGTTIHVFLPFSCEERSSSLTTNQNSWMP